MDSSLIMGKLILPTWVMISSIELALILLIMILKIKNLKHMIKLTSFRNGFIINN